MSKIRNFLPVKGKPRIMERTGRYGQAGVVLRSPLVTFGFVLCWHKGQPFVEVHLGRVKLFCGRFQSQRSR